MTPDRLLGIDVSSWQRDVDWWAVANAGRSFAFIKATEGDGYVNPYFTDAWKQAKLAGLVRGAYLYAQPDLASPVDHVTLFEQTVGALEAGDMIVLDLEEGHGNLLRWADECADLMHRVMGVRTIIYSGDWFLIPHGCADPQLGRWPLWKASYQHRPPPTTPGWEHFPFWQYTARGIVPGVDGPCDENVFFGSRAALAAYGRMA